MYGTPLEWDPIKNNLITHYADKRNETSLIRDLYSITQGSDTIEKYFSKIIDIHSTIINHVKLNETSFLVINAKKDLYHEMCLNTFLAGLREPLGSMIRAMQPRTLSDAFSNCLKEQNIGYMRKGSNVNLAPLPSKPQKLGYPPRNNYPSGPPILLPQKVPQYNYRSTPQYYNHRPFTNQNHHPNNRNYSFKPPMVPPRKVEPMDTVSNENKYKQPTNFNRGINYQFRPTGPPRVHVQEMYHTENLEEEQIQTIPEEYEEEQQLYFPDLDEGEVDDSNFHQQASPPELDI